MPGNAKRLGRTRANQIEAGFTGLEGEVLIDASWHFSGAVTDINNLRVTVCSDVVNSAKH